MLEENGEDTFNLEYVDFVSNCDLKLAYAYDIFSTSVIKKEDFPAIKKEGGAR